MANELDTSLLTEDLKGYLIAVTNAGETASANAQKAKESVGRLQGIMQEAAKASATIEYQKGTADLAAQNATRRAAIAVGVNPEAGVDTLTEIMSRLKETNKNIIDTAADIRKKKSTSLWSDPVQFIKDNFFLPDSEQKLKANVEEAKALSGTLGLVSKAVSETSQTYQALKETTTQATIEARTKLAAADAAVKAEELNIQGIKYDTESVNAIAAMSKAQVDAWIAYRGTQDASTRLQLALDSSALQREQFDWARSEREIAQAAKNADKLIDDQTLEYINRSKAALGQPPLTKDEYKYQAALLKSGKSTELAYHLENGMRNAMTGTSMVGANPAESLSVIKEFPSDLPAIQQETLKLIDDAERLVKSKPHDPKDIKGIADKTNFTVKEIVAEQYANIRSGSLLDVGDLTSYIGTGSGKDTELGIGGLNSLPISRKLLLPLAKAGQPLEDTKVILGLVTKAVRDGTITSSEALGLSDIYRQASQINMVARGFTKFGITVPENGTKYRISLGSLFNRDVIDLNDPVSLSSYIAKNTSAFYEKRNTGKP